VDLEENFGLQSVIMSQVRLLETVENNMKYGGYTLEAGYSAKSGRRSMGLILIPVKDGAYKRIGSYHFFPNHKCGGDSIDKLYGDGRRETVLIL